MITVVLEIETEVSAEGPAGLALADAADAYPAAATCHAARAAIGGIDRQIDAEPVADRADRPWAVRRAGAIVRVVGAAFLAGNAAVVGVAVVAQRRADARLVLTGCSRRASEAVPLAVGGPAGADAGRTIDALRAAGAAALTADRLAGVLADAGAAIEIEQEITAIVLGEGAGGGRGGGAPA